MYRVILTLMLLIVGSAAGMAQTVAPKKADVRKSVGVISAIGSKFALQKIGMTVFQNELKEVPIEAWGIDDAVLAKVAQHLGKRYDVRKVSYARNAFAEFESEGGSLFRDREEELKNAVRRIAAAAPQKSDQYLLVMRSGSKFGNSNQFVMGLGMVEASSILLSTLNLHALSMIRVYEGRTFAVVAEKRATNGPYNIFAVIQGPHRELDKALWPASGSVAQNERLKILTRALLEKSLDVTLSEMMRTD